MLDLGRLVPVAGVAIVVLVGCAFLFFYIRQRLGRRGLVFVWLMTTALAAAGLVVLGHRPLKSVADAISILLIPSLTLGVGALMLDTRPGRRLTPKLAIWAVAMMMLAFLCGLFLLLVFSSGEL